MIDDFDVNVCIEELEKLESKWLEEIWEVIDRE